MFISMNCENSCGYLCFCCVDAVDCGAASPRCMEMGLTWMFMDEYGLGAPPLPPLWIADQVRNELAPRSYPAATQRGIAGSYLAARCSAWRSPAVVSTLWFPAFAGMTVGDAGMTGVFIGVKAA